MPIAKEANPRSKNDPIVLAMLRVAPSSKRATTVLNRMMATASLTIPSPKIILKSLG